jgi:hypothetical protein
MWTGYEGATGNFLKRVWWSDWPVKHEIRVEFKIFLKNLMGNKDILKNLLTDENST